MTTVHRVLEAGEGLLWETVSEMRLSIKGKNDRKISEPRGYFFNKNIWECFQETWNNLCIHTEMRLENKLGSILRLKKLIESSEKFLNVLGTMKYLTNVCLLWDHMLF